MSIPQEIIASKILLIRGRRVMLDRDLAELYGVETRNLKRQVRRNAERFPEDFMFQLSQEEFENWRCQFGTSNSADRMGLRYPPYAFTDYGILMLSSVLKSDLAIKVNIQIMRFFIKMREMLFNYKDLQDKVEKMEKKYDKQFQVVFEAIKQLIKQERQPKKNIGFQSK
jgi:hypothetical protein